MNKLVSQIVALGVPGLVLLVAINVSGYYGGAAIMVALSSLGPGGVVGGLITLGLIGAISHGIAEYGFERIARSVLYEMYAKGESPESIRKKVSKMPVSKSLKSQLADVVSQFSKR